jgi:integrase
MRGSKRRRSASAWELQAYDRTKKRYKYRTVKAKSAREADKLLAAFVAEVDGGKAPDAPARLLMKTVCDEWLETKRFKSPSTKDNYTWAMSHVYRELGSMEIRRIGLRQLEAFYNKIEERLAAKSIRAVHNVLRQTFDYAKRARYVISNPALDVRGLPEVNAWRIDAPTVDQVNEFLAAVRETQGSTWYAFVVLVASTGMRRGEACGLRWSNVNLDEDEVTIERVATVVDGIGKYMKEYPKTRGSIRTIKIDPTVAQLLVEQRKRLDKAREGVEATKPVEECFVFSPDPFGEVYFSPNSVSQMFRKVQGALEDNGIHCHKLRHFSATQAVLQGVPITEVMGRHGWTSYQTAMKYQHYTGARDAEAARAVASVLNIGRSSGDR